MTKDLPSRPTGRAALQGTAMHKVLENCLKKGKHPSVFLDHVFNIEGEDVVFDEDRVKWTTETLEWIQKYKSEHKGSHLISEVRVEITEDVWGTPDVTIYSKDELCIIDLKGGYVDVEIEDNYQLILYGIGALRFIEDAMDVPPIQAIRLVIHQPRSGGAKQLVVDRTTLEDWNVYIEKAAKEAKSERASLRASDEACKWCPAIGYCPAAHQRATELARNTDWPEVVRTITEEQLVQLLDRAGYIRTFLQAAEDYAVSRLSNGYSIPGFKLVAGNKHRKWVDEEKAAALCGPEFYKRQALTPAQAEKKFKDLDLSEYIVKPLGDPELAPVSDPRPTIPFKDLKVLEGGLDNPVETVVESKTVVPTKRKRT
jgi:hypothetical protein